VVPALSRNTVCIFRKSFWEAAMPETMPETLELILWCAALATWLILLFRFLREPYKALSKAIRRLVEMG
jgi:hypothetical protein